MDENIQPLDELDAIDFKDVSTDYPVLAEGVYRVFVRSLQLKRNKKDTGNVLHVALSLTSPGKDRNDKDLLEGFTFTETVSTEQTEKYNPLPLLAKIMLCFTGSKGRMPWKDMVDMKGDVRVKIEENETYGARNRVSNWIAKREEDIASSL